MRIRLFFCALPLVALLPPGVQAQQFDVSSEQSRAVLTGGISYDLLRYPTNVSFDYPEGYLTFNVPLDLTTNKYDFFQDLDSANQKFTPLIGAKQRLNFSFRINVPMLRGVWTYAQTENVNFEMDMNMGVGFDTLAQDSLGSLGTTNFSLKGAVNAPIRYAMGWRSQTFGYAFKPRSDLTVALQLHNHLFEATANGLFNINLLGNVGIDIQSPEIGKREDNIPFSYSEEDVAGQVSGKFKGEAWSPAFGVKWWRIILTSRFGVHTKVKGHFTMRFQTPFFLNPDPKSGFEFQESELVPEGLQTDSAGGLPADAINEIENVRTRIESSETDSFVLTTKKEAEFNIPSGHSIAFEAVRNHLIFSYTYVDGAISGHHKNESGEVDFHMGFEANHFFMMDLMLFRAKMQLGLFALDYYEGYGPYAKPNWLSEGVGIDFLGGVPVPVLNLSTSIGSTARVLLELDILPIPALKTGLLYYF